MGPFGPHPAGRFDFDPPDDVVYVERLLRRVRGLVDGNPVVDSEDAVLVHETDSLPHDAFPVDDVVHDAEPEPHADGYVTVPWDAVDA